MKGIPVTGGTVWKFDLKHEEPVKILMPKGALPLHIAFQGDDLRLWALVNPAAPAEGRLFYVIPTGLKPLPVSDWAYKYLGTALHSGGTVWHVFEAVEKAQALLEALL